MSTSRESLTDFQKRLEGLKILLTKFSEHIHVEIENKNNEKKKSEKSEQEDILYQNSLHALQSHLNLLLNLLNDLKLEDERNFDTLRADFSQKISDLIKQLNNIKEFYKEKLSENLLKEINNWILYFEKKKAEANAEKQSIVKANAEKSDDAKPLTPVHYPKESQEYKNIYYSLIFDLRFDNNARRALKENKEYLKAELIQELLKTHSKAKISTSLRFHDKKIHELKQARQKEKEKGGAGDPDDQMKFFWKEDKDRFKKELLELYALDQVHLEEELSKLTTPSSLLMNNLKKYRQKEVDNIRHSREITSKRLEIMLSSKELKESTKIKVLRTEYDILSQSSPKGLLTNAIGAYLKASQNLNGSPAEQTQNVEDAKKLLNYIDEFERSVTYKMAKIFHLGKDYDSILEEIGEIAHQLILNQDRQTINKMIRNLKTKIEDFDERYPKLSKILIEIQNLQPLTKEQINPIIAKINPIIDKLNNGHLEIDDNLLKNCCIIPTSKNLKDPNNRFFSNFSNSRKLQFLVRNIQNGNSVSVEINLKDVKKWNENFNNANLTNTEFFKEKNLTDAEFLNSNENKRNFLSMISPKLHGLFEDSVRSVMKCKNGKNIKIKRYQRNLIGNLNDITDGIKDNDENKVRENLEKIGNILNNELNNCRNKTSSFANYISQLKNEVDSALDSISNLLENKFNTTRSQSIRP